MSDDQRTVLIRWHNNPDPERRRETEYFGEPIIGRVVFEGSDSLDGPWTPLFVTTWASTNVEETMMRFGIPQTHEYVRVCRARPGEGDNLIVEF